jgi:hypothetical protein
VVVGADATVVSEDAQRGNEMATLPCLTRMNGQPAAEAGVDSLSLNSVAPRTIVSGLRDAAMSRSSFHGRDDSSSGGGGVGGGGGG